MIWIVLFFLILLISFILALRSMSDYHELPQSSKQPYSVYLIKNPANLNAAILSPIINSIGSGIFLSFERLFRGDRTAMVVYGPISFLEPLKDTLGLVELEDYSQRIDAAKPDLWVGEVAAWEVGSKRGVGSLSDFRFKGSIPTLAQNEEFWWQMVVRPVSSKDNFNFQNTLALITNSVKDIINRYLTKSESGSFEQADSFETVTRAVVWTDNERKLRDLQDQLSKIGNDLGLSALPQSFASMDLVGLYQKRAFPLGKALNIGVEKKQLFLNLSPEQMIKVFLAP